METLNKSLRKIFSDVKEQLASAHDRSKKRYDKGVSGEKFTVGDQVWLFVPAVKQGRTEKLASLWRGPYTLIDPINAWCIKLPHPASGLHENACCPS